MTTNEISNLALLAAILFSVLSVITLIVALVAAIVAKCLANAERQAQSGEAIGSKTWWAAGEIGKTGSFYRGVSCASITIATLLLPLVVICLSVSKL